MSHPTNKDELPSLSDYDVQLLHRIVSLAEDSDEPPFRALFAAYDQTLAEYGIKADHDRVYFRFLLRMGEPRSANSGLFERFQGLLWKLGIEVAFGDDDPNGRKIPPDEILDEEEEEDRSHVYGQYDVREQNVNPSRRSSFEEVQEHGERLRTQQKPQKHSRSRSFDDATQMRSTEDILSSARAKLKTNPTRAHIAYQGSKSRPTHPRRTDMKHSQLLIDNDLTVDSEDSDDLDDSDDADESVKSGSAPKMDARRALSVHRGQDRHQMDMNARNLRYHHLAAQAILIFRSWTVSAAVVRRNHTQMLSIAVTKDRETLSRQAMEQWRMKLRERRRERETESFYERLAQEAQRARDLFLLSKAFTHWAELTSEEVARTSAAQRFVLKSRYFNAWREVSVVNEFKVRRQGMLKFWQIWRSRARKVRDSERSAVSLRDLSSAEKCYRHWFWAFCERRAPLWYDCKIKESSLSKWVLSSRQNMVREQLAVDLNSFQLIRKFTIRWINRSAALVQNAQEAQEFRQRMLMLPVVEWLRKELELLPMQSQVSCAVRFRTLNEAMKCWRHRTQNCLEAERVNRLRVLRNTWTCWNDRLRCQTLSNSIDERVVLSAMYKWVLAERSRLLRRVADDNLKARVISLWKLKTNELGASLNTPYHLVRSLSTCQAARSILQQWHYSSMDIEGLKDEAQSFTERSSLTNGIRAWAVRYQRCGELDEWATNAYFYMTTNRVIKKWQDRTAASRKAKRREAYASFRRNVKVALARKILRTWHSAAARAEEFRAQADEMYDQHLRQVHESCYDSWRAKSLVLHRHYSQAKGFDEHRLLRRCWDHCTGLVETFSRQQEVASAYLRLATEAVSTKALRQMTWRVFQLKGQHELAESLLNRTSKKHYRNMLRYWASQLRRRQNNEQASVLGDAHVVEGQALDEWPDVEDSIFAARSQLSARIPPTPGYLRTPSRRHASRNNAYLKLPKTPATINLTPRHTSTKIPFPQTEPSQSTRNTFVRRLIENQGQ